MTGIYKITNLINRKVYIGQAIDIEKRFVEHQRSLKGKYHINEHLQNSYNKYGKENFKFEVIEECLEENLTEREQYWIDYYGGINCKTTYNKRDANMKGHLSEDTKRKMSLYWKGRIISEKTRQKMKDNHADVSGKNNPMYGTLGGMYGKKHTEEWKRKQSERFKGKNNPRYGKNNDFNSGRIYVNNGKISKMIYPKDLEKYKELGFTKGRILKGKIYNAE